jgi:hypothetical protein
VGISRIIAEAEEETAMNNFKTREELTAMGTPLSKWEYDGLVAATLAAEQGVFHWVSYADYYSTKEIVNGFNMATYGPPGPRVHCGLGWAMEYANNAMINGYHSFDPDNAMPKPFEHRYAMPAIMELSVMGHWERPPGGSMVNVTPQEWAKGARHFLETGEAPDWNLILNQ